MKTEKNYLDLIIVDALAEEVEELHSLAAGDIFGDGNNVVVTGGKMGLFWYLPFKNLKGKIDEGFFHVGLYMHDLDNDGILEVIASEQDNYTHQFRIVWYKPSNCLDEPWQKYIIDPICKGNPHDFIFADIDSDGKAELVSVATYTQTPGVYIYKPAANIYDIWNRYPVMEGHLSEGLAVSDINSDGSLEIICGPDYYVCPKEGPYSGLWERYVYAPNFRDMCRVAVTDITGNGRDDIIIVESEYREGQLSWFENRLLERPDNPWIEHRVKDDFLFAHSLQVYIDTNTNQKKVFVAEMDEGGWNSPYNWDARLLEYTIANNEQKWEERLLYKGAGTHQAIAIDIDLDGQFEFLGKTWKHPVVQIFKEPKKASIIKDFKHSFIDRDKNLTGIDIFAADIDNDGSEDVICAKWWYKSPRWEKFEIPAIYQVINVYDIDGDGQNELICIKQSDSKSDNFLDTLSSNLCWIKAIDAEKGIWEEYEIGIGSGSWPHGAELAPVLPNGKIALVLTYHSAKHQDDFPEIFEMPDNPKQKWPKKTLVKLNYGEDVKSGDLNRDGFLDFVLGNNILFNNGDGSFETFRYCENFNTARVCLADINNDGFVDIIAGEEIFKKYGDIMWFSQLAWFENPGGNCKGNWKKHIIDNIRCPHSISVSDIDGDGEIEIICAEHDPFKRYRSRSRLFVYKKADYDGIKWKRFLLDDRFEHHNGAKIITLRNGQKGIISHGWGDKQYINLWSLED